MVKLIKLVAPIDLIAPTDLVEPIKPISLVDLIGLKNRFLVSKPKFLLRLALTKVFILALGGSFCYMSLMASSNEH